MDYNVIFIDYKDNKINKLLKDTMEIILTISMYFLIWVKLLHFTSVIFIFIIKLTYSRKRPSGKSVDILLYVN